MSNIKTSNSPVSQDTIFWNQVKEKNSGQLATPKVSTATGSIDYFGYQLAVHKFQLSLYSKNIIPCRGWKVTELKRYYGLTGSDRHSYVKQITQIMEVYSDIFLSKSI